MTGIAVIQRSAINLTEPANDDPPLPKKGEVEGFSTFSYQLAEDKNLTATGVFKGKMIVMWFKKVNAAPVYN